MVGENVGPGEIVGASVVGKADGVRDGLSDGELLGRSVGSMEGCEDANSVGLMLGSNEGGPDGFTLGATEATRVGAIDGSKDGNLLGIRVEGTAVVGVAVGFLVGGSVGSMATVTPLKTIPESSKYCGLFP